MAERDLMGFKSKKAQDQSALCLSQGKKTQPNQTTKKNSKPKQQQQQKHTHKQKQRNKQPKKILRHWLGTIHESFLAQNQKGPKKHPPQKNKSEKSVFWGLNRIFKNSYASTNLGKF